MTQQKSSFKAGIHFDEVLAIISKQIYETPLAFIRENVQNAVDAVKQQAFGDELDPSDARYAIEIAVTDLSCQIRDRGIGMTQADLQNFYWTIGASGKRTPEARKAGCIGMFGIGGFANFGVCKKLEVISQVQGAEIGTATVLSKEDIEAAGPTIPDVHFYPSDQAGPRGTLVIGSLSKAANIDELKTYLGDFVRYVPTPIYFNRSLISQADFITADEQKNLMPIYAGDKTWSDGDLSVSGKLYEDGARTIVAILRSLTINSEKIPFQAQLRFESGAIDLFKRRFKLCATRVGSRIGVSGRLDCDRFVPTAGRDSLDSESSSLLNRIALCMEQGAIEAILESSERIAQNTRIFPRIIELGWVDRMGNATVHLAGGRETTLNDVRAAKGKGSTVFFGREQKQALNQVMEAQGHLVVLLSRDAFRQTAETQFLQRFCDAKPFEGLIDCKETYQHLTRFEQIVLADVEMTIRRAYDLLEFRVIAGKLTEDIPVFVRDEAPLIGIDIFIDVRHPEVTKLEPLGMTPLLYSMLSAFCREYLGPSLRKWSPKFFGSGAINLEAFAKRRSELWILLKDDVEVVRRNSEKQVVRTSDISIVTIGAQPAVNKRPRIIHIVGDEGQNPINGFYIRIPDGAFAAYGDIILECNNRGVVWAGNKILYVASDAVSTSFQFEIRLDQIIVLDRGTGKRSEGASELTLSPHELFGGLYFPIVDELTSFLVPSGDMEIRLEVRCDLIDMATSRQWRAAAD